MKFNIVNSVEENEIIFVVNKDFDHKFIKDKESLKALGFEGAEEESIYLTDKKRVYVGIDDRSDESLRLGTCVALKALKKYKITSASIAMYCFSARGIVEGALLGTYSFEKYKSKKSEYAFEALNIVQEFFEEGLKEKVTDLEKEISDAQALSKSVNFTRDLVNTIPQDINPPSLAKIAKKVAKEQNLEIDVLKTADLEKEGMNAFLAVNRASVHGARLIHLKYKPKNAKAKVAFVGKGLTYDSGGLSLKPADFMTTMKSDKSGACAVLGAIQAASQMGLDVEIHAVLGAAENMVGGDAYKPDDVLVAKNGKTIEVKNTDAEGRLVLADSLCYIQEKEKEFDYIFDFATLTGACVVALGEYTSGVMGHNTTLKHKLVKAAHNSGELAASLPFNKYLKKLIKSEVADICNIGASRYGGAITAGLFLDEFIEEEYKDKWLHIDIAGPAYVEKAWGYNPFGASGAGVRLAVEFLRSL